MKYLRLISLIVIFIFWIGIVSAANVESHNVISVTTKTYVTAASPPNHPGTINLSGLGFYNSGYNSVESIKYTSDMLVFAHNSNTVGCHIIGGGTGDCVFSYVKGATAAENYITWYFSDAIITDTNVVIEYDNASVIAEITSSNPFEELTGITNDRPVLIKNSGNFLFGGVGTYETSVSLFVSYSWNVTYAAFGSNIIWSGYFQKTTGQPYTTMNISNATAKIYIGTTDATSFNVSQIYTDGLYLNVTFLDGVSYLYTINSTGSPFVEPAVTPDPLTGVGIKFDASSYNIGGTANITWIRESPTPLGYEDDIYLIKPSSTGGTIKKILFASPPDSGYIKTNDFPIAGEYNVSFERSIGGLFIEVLASDTATISAEQASYILVNETVPVGVYLSGNYSAGWTGVGRIVIYEDMPDGTIKEIDSLPISGTCCVETTVNQLFFPEAGNYRVVLMKGYDTVKATSSVTAYFTDLFTPVNITVSNISLNKNQYTYGEPYTITCQVDSFNYSTKAKRIIAYEVATGANTLVSQVPAQTGSITRTFDSEMYPFSGALQLRLMGLNDTGDYLLASVNFTLSTIDTEGYGLDITKSPICTGETGYYTYYSPGAVNIQMANKDVTVYSRNFTSAVSGKTVPFTIKNPGTYEVFLRPSNETDVKFTKIIEVKACDAVAGTTPTTQAKAQNEMALLLTSSFIWALILTVGLMIAVGIEMKQKKSDALIPMIATGFLSLAAFTWLTWIPAVVFWSIVLLIAVIFAWQRAKDMNTAGE